MSNQLDANGLTVASFTEIVAALTASLQAVYGDDINVEPNSPDGQNIAIFAQSVSDMLETLLDTYNIFFVDAAYGVMLDQLVAINGLVRNPGSFTEVYVQVTASEALTLPGQETTTPFTIADDAGNQFQLAESYVYGAAGVATLLFKAVLLGRTEVLANTLTNIVTTTLGITAVNNAVFTVTTPGTIVAASPIVTAIADTTGMTAGMDLDSATSLFPAGTKVLSVDSSTQITADQDATGSATENITVSTPPTDIGVAEENDVQLKVRRAKSFYLQTVGPAQAIRSALLATEGVTDAYVAENVTAMDADGVPAHGVWIIVNGGADADVGAAIYAKKAPGCDMEGSESYVVNLPQGNSFTAKWDLAESEDLHIRATLNARFPGQVFDLTADKAALAAALVYKLGEKPSIGDVILAMADIEPNAVLSVVNVSTDGISWVDIVTPSDFQHFFQLVVGNITLTQA
jgi:hypothetical protein